MLNLIFLSIPSMNKKVLPVCWNNIYQGCISVYKLHIKKNILFISPYCKYFHYLVWGWNREIVLASYTLHVLLYVCVLAGGLFQPPVPYFYMCVCWQEDCGLESLLEISTIMRESDVSPFEVIHSGLVERLLQYLTTMQGAVPRDVRIRRFLHVFLNCPVCSINIFKNPRKLFHGLSWWCFFT